MRMPPSDDLQGMHWKEGRCGGKLPGAMSRTTYSRTFLYGGLYFLLSFAVVAMAPSFDSVGYPGDDAVLMRDGRFRVSPSAIISVFQPLVQVANTIILRCFLGTGMTRAGFLRLTIGIDVTVAVLWSLLVGLLIALLAEKAMKRRANPRA